MTSKNIKCWVREAMDDKFGADRHEIRRQAKIAAEAKIAAAAENAEADRIATENDDILF